MNRNCTACNTKIDINKYKKDKTVCKSCYNKNRNKGKNNNNTLPPCKITASHQQPKIENVKSSRNKSKIVGISKCGKSYLTNHILHRKRQPIFSNTKSVNQYPNIKAKTSDEIQPLNEYENSTVNFDDMLLSKQEGNIDLFFTRGRHNNSDMYYISQS